MAKTKVNFYKKVTLTITLANLLELEIDTYLAREFLLRDKGRKLQAQRAIRAIMPVLEANIPPPKEEE